MTRWFSLDLCPGERREAGKLLVETRGGWRVRRRSFRHTTSKTHAHALHAKDLAKKSPVYLSSDTSTHTLTYTFSPVFISHANVLHVYLFFKHRRKSSASMLRATEYGSSFLHAWETVVSDALSSGIFNVSLWVALHNCICRIRAKTYRADFTGGKTKQNGVIHPCPSLFNSNSNESPWQST